MDFKPEFSRPILVDTIPTRGVDMEIEASAAECAALAERFGIVKVTDFKAKAHLRALAGGTLFKVDGHIRAVVEQTCVVTLEPVEQVVDESFMITFGTAAESDTLELDLSMDDDDPPEPLTDGAIDLGEVVAEHLALALDPFPRKADAQLPEIKEDAPIKEEKVSPFAALAAFKQKNS